MLKNALLLAAALLALAAGYWTAHSLRTPEPSAIPKHGGGDMIDFTLPDLDGKNRRLSEWRGKVIVLNFWATWCPPCREEIPLFISLQKQHGADGVQIVGVAVDRIEPVMAYNQSAGINYPTLIGDEDAMQAMTRYGNPKGSLPFTVIIDRRGAIVTRKLGPFNRKELKQLIDPLLSSQKAPVRPE